MKFPIENSFCIGLYTDRCCIHFCNELHFAVPFAGRLWGNGPQKRNYWYGEKVRVMVSRTYYAYGL